MMNPPNPVPDAEYPFKSDFSDKTLLVITPDYPDKDNRYIGSIFVKNQLDSLKIYFRKIIVIAPVLYSGGILPNDRYCQNYSLDNIDIYYPRCLFFPRSLIIPFVKNAYKLSIDTRLSAVLRLIRQEHLEFDLVHAHFTWPSASIAAAIKETWHVPVVATIHEDSGWLQEEIALNDLRLISAWQQADALIRVNREELPLLQKFNHNVFFVPNGFPSRFGPLDSAECRVRLGLSTEKKVIFCLGDLVQRKGFSYLVEAMTRIKASRSDVICCIGGKGPEEKNLIRQIHENGLDDCTRLLGFVPDQMVPVWMNAADLFVLPSIHESFGIVQIEALACGTPAISTDTVGSREIMVSEDVGLLCEPANAASLADAILRGLEITWDHKKILDYSAPFSWDHVVKSLIPIYSDVIMKAGKMHE
jgi:teichuronic acid biosynthesis glycosyltransferase TuaC